MNPKLKKILIALGLGTGAWLLFSSFTTNNEGNPDIPVTEDPTLLEKFGFTVKTVAANGFVVVTNQPFTAAQVAKGRYVGLSFTNGAYFPGKYYVQYVYNTTMFSVYFVPGNGMAMPAVGSTGRWTAYDNSLEAGVYNHGAIFHFPGRNVSAAITIGTPALNVGDEINILTPGPYQGIKIITSKIDNVYYTFNQMYSTAIAGGTFKVHKLNTIVPVENPLIVDIAFIGQSLVSPTLARIVTIDPNPPFPAGTKVRILNNTTYNNQIATITGKALVGYDTDMPYTSLATGGKAVIQ
jgi:hypothetical protein